MKKYTFDMRKTMLEVNKHSNYAKLLGEAMLRYGFEDEHRANICFEDLEVGMHLYLVDDGPNKPGYKKIYKEYEIEVTHIYGGIMFFKRIEYPELEEYCPFSSFMGMHMLYPYEIITMEPYSMECSCTSVKITVDNDTSTIGSYSTTYDINDKQKFPRI